MSKIYVLDACSIIALLMNEDGADVVDNILVQAREKTCTIYMNKLNLLEVYYGFYRSDGQKEAEKHIDSIKASSITIIDELTDNVFAQAGRLKASYKISFADSIVLAEGITKGAIVVSSDHHEFDIIEQSENIKFLWIR